MDQDAHKIRLVMELRRANLCDTRVLSAIETTPRELFVPRMFRDRAYENTALPIACGQTISQPHVVAFMTEALKVDERMKVLEIGTGSGYQAAVLAKLCRRVYTVDRHRALVREAEKLLAAVGICNVTTMVGNGARGWPEQAPFDRIMVTAAAATLPQILIDQLAPGAVLIVPVGGPGEQQEVVRVTKRDQGYSTERLLPVRFVPLIDGVAADS
ncbi:MAG: protein-L-isoaspartate(D-aspartate) O-methyltransferase [Sphingomonadales bacterium]